MASQRKNRRTLVRSFGRSESLGRREPRALVSEPLEVRALCSVDLGVGVSGAWPEVLDAQPVGALQASVGLSSSLSAAKAPVVKDDAPNTPGPTAPVIALDVNGRGARAGKLEVKGDRDAFRFTITAGGSYQFDQIGSSLADAYLRLYNGDRVLLACWLAPS
jgi:hypothetical protein